MRVCVVGVDGLRVWHGDKGMAWYGDKGMAWHGGMATGDAGARVWARHEDKGRECGCVVGTDSSSMGTCMGMGMTAVRALG